MRKKPKGVHFSRYQKKSQLLADNIFRLRLKNEWTQKQLSLLCSLSPTMISELESNKINPTLHTLVCLCEAFSVSLNDLFEEL